MFMLCSKMLPNKDEYLIVFTLYACYTGVAYKEVHVLMPIVTEVSNVVL